MSHPLSKDTLLDITHEALLRNWDKLQSWAWEEHEREIILREMLAQLEKWLKNNRDTQYLLSAGSLSYFEKWWSGIEVNKAMWMRRYLDGGIRHDDLQDKERKTQNAKQKKQEIEEYISDSRNYHNRKKRIQRIAIGIICVLLVTAVGGLIYSWNLKNKISVTSHSNAIATKAYRTLEKDPTLAFRLAEQAYKIAPEPLAKEVLMASYGEMPFYQVLRGHTLQVTNIKISPDGKLILTSSIDTDLRLWDFETTKEIFILKGHIGPLYHGNPESINFSPNSKLFVSASSDSTARLWEVSSGKCLAIMKHKRAVSSAVFSHDGLKIMTASGKSVMIWNLKGNELFVLKDYGRPIKTALFTPNDSLIIAGAGTSIKIWNFKGDSINELTGHKKPIFNISISKDGNYVASGAWDATAHIWGLKENSHYVLRGHEDLVALVSFTNDCKNLLTASKDNTARIWTLKGEEEKVLRGHTAFVWSISQSPDGKQILTASDDGTARLWDLSGTELMVLKGHTDQVMSANFSPNGNYVVTASGDKTARIWNIKPKEIPSSNYDSLLLKGIDISPDSVNKWLYKINNEKVRGEVMELSKEELEIFGVIK